MFIRYSAGDLNEVSKLHTSGYTSEITYSIKPIKRITVSGEKCRFVSYLGFAFNMPHPLSYAFSHAARR